MGQIIRKDNKILPENLREEKGGVPRNMLKEFPILLINSRYIEVGATLVCFDERRRTRARTGFPVLIVSFLVF